MHRARQRVRHRCSTAACGSTSGGNSRSRCSASSKCSRSRSRACCAVAVARASLNAELARARRDRGPATTRPRWAGRAWWPATQRVARHSPRRREAVLGVVLEDQHPVRQHAAVGQALAQTLGQRAERPRRSPRSAGAGSRAARWPAARPTDSARTRPARRCLGRWIQYRRSSAITWSMRSAPACAHAGAQRLHERREGGALERARNRAAAGPSFVRRG